MKTCSKCQQTLPFSAFHANARARDGCASYCKACALAVYTAWRKANPTKRARAQRAYHSRHRTTLAAQRRARRAANPQKAATAQRILARRSRLKKYGLTEESFAAKLAKQNAMCALCDKSLTITTAVLDHCHVTGRVRDLLCFTCNASLGHIERSGFLERAIAYIERHRSMG